MSMTEEKAIEIIDKMIKSYIEADECGLSNNDFKHEIEAMQTVLNMLKEKDKRIKELEEEKKNRVDFQKKYIEVTNLYLNSISKQKIKDKIEELKKEYKIALEENSTKAFILKCKINVLEEILEEKQCQKNKK